jgi:hypothetical protein
MTRQDTEGNGGTLPAVATGRERRPGFRAIGDTVSRIARPIAAARGGGALVRLKTEWAAIVGPELAGICWPEALGRDGALKLRCTPAYALDLQHCTPLIIERANLFFGRAVVARVALVQGSLPFAPPNPVLPPPVLSAAQQRQLDSRLSEIENAELRDALTRFGRTLLARDIAGE